MATSEIATIRARGKMEAAEGKSAPAGKIRPGKMWLWGVYRWGGFLHIPPPMFSIALNVLLTINVIVALLIVLVVLMQRPKNEGLGAAFGGGVTDNLFGAQTTTVRAKITRWLGGIFFVNSLILTYLSSNLDKSSRRLNDQLKRRLLLSRF